MGLLSAILTPLGPLLAPVQPLVDELSKLGTPAAVAVSFVAFVTLTVVLNVLQQLLLKDPRKPPVVFHLFPFFGSTVIYGMDPYKFFFNCKEKVCATRVVAGGQG